MYTLEDDHETSSRYKRDLAGTTPQIGTFGEPSTGSDAGTDQDAPASAEMAPASAETMPAHAETVAAVPAAPPQRQATGSFKALTTPARATAGGQKMALAALTVACISVFFTALDQTVVVTALPQMISDLHIPFTQLDHAAWIISAYLLGFIVAMPLMGRVSDIYGRRRIFLLCLMIFGLGSILCGLAPLLGAMFNLSFLSILHIDTSSPGLTWLISARLFQAIGGGAVVPVAMAIAGDFYGQERRGLALGIIGAVTEAGGAIGPLYGAVVVEHLGWQYIFYLNAPVVIALIVAVWILIPTGKRLHERIDWLGAALLGLALTCLSLGLAQQGTSLGPVAASSAAPQNNPVVLALAAVFLLAFILVERKVRWPVIELAVFKRLTFSASALVSLFVGAALIIAMSDIPIYVDTVLRLPVLDSGLALLRLTVMIPPGALLGGWLCSRVSCRVTGVLGLLFTAGGFFLMSRWPVQVDWLQMTTGTMTAGFGFGLVIAPIGTTAINAVRSSQAGMGSAIVTALRMVGMTLGLAVLTSWALAYFKQLVAAYPSLPVTASAAQLTKWSKGYAVHVIGAEHTVYTTVFFISMVLCLVAIVPALFLWGSKPPLEELEPEIDAAIYDMPTVPVPVVAAATTDVGESQVEGPMSREGTPPGPGKGTGWWHKRRRAMIFASIGLVALLVGGGLFAEYWFGVDDAPPDTTPNGPTGISSGSATSTAVVAGPRMIQLALDRDALTSIFVSQLNLQQGVISDLSVTPAPDDGLVLSLNLHIDANGIHRVLPVELDGSIGIDQQQNLQLSVGHLKRDGLDAGPAAAASMQTAINEMLASAVMPALHNQLKNVKLVSVHTSTTIGCGQGVEMLVLQVEAPPIMGVAAQPTPVPFCFKGPVDLNKLLPH